MGLPSLLEDIIQKGIDDWLQSEVPSAQIYTRDDFKRAVAQMGLNARALLKVSDKELLEIAEAFAVDADVNYREIVILREANEALRLAVAGLEADKNKLQAEATDDRDRVRKLEKKLTKSISKLKADHESAASNLRDQLARRSAMLLKRNVEKAVLERQVAQLESNVVGLRDLRKLTD